MTLSMRAAATAAVLLIARGASAQAPAKPDATSAATAKIIADSGVVPVPFSAPESVQRLERSHHKVDFFHLVNHFEGQSTLPACGPTAAVIVLNALRADNPAMQKPRDPAVVTDELRAFVPKGLEPVMARYTQATFFNAKTDEVKSRAEVFGKPKTPGARPDGGMQLRQLHEMLLRHGLDSQLRVVGDQVAEADVKKEIIDNLAHDGDYVIVNFFRPALGERGGGHISPLGAYDEASDSFLIIDVNPTAYPWSWVPAASLVKAMRTKDTVENRGYLLVREGKAPPAKP